MNKRKLIKYLLLTLLAILLATGCSKSVEIQDVSGGAEDVDSQQEQQDESGQSKDIAEEIPSLQPEEVDHSGESTEQKGSMAEPVEQKEVASVIVKSENNLSDAEKQEIVDQLSKEVDDLLNEINSVE